MSKKVCVPILKDKAEYKSPAIVDKYQQKTLKELSETPGEGESTSRDDNHEEDNHEEDNHEDNHEEDNHKENNHEENNHPHDCKCI